MSKRTRILIAMCVFRTQDTQDKRTIKYARGAKLETVIRDYILELKKENIIKQDYELFSQTYIISVTPNEVIDLDTLERTEV